MTNFNLKDDIFEKHLQDPIHENNANIIKMLTHLALCHTVVIENKNGK